MQLGQRLQKMLFENQELREENNLLSGLQAERDALEEKADVLEGELDDLHDKLACSEELCANLRSALDQAAK
jgi:hypothetical protein